MALQLGPGEAKKSFLYRAPLHAGTFHFDRVIATGQGCKLEGFNLVSMTLGTGIEGELLVRLSPGKFVSKGIVVDVSSETDIHIPRFWETESSVHGLAIYAYTDSPFQNAEDVYIGFTWVNSLQSRHALLGQVYFDYDGDDSLLDNLSHRTNKDYPTWLPAPDAMMSRVSKPDEEFTVATMALPVSWQSGTAKSGEADIAITPPVANVSVTMGYEVNSTIPLTSDYHMLFASGRLLVEGLDYFIDSPGRAIVWSTDYSGQVQPYVTGSWGISSYDVISGSFDVFATKGMSFRYDSPFDGNAGSEVKIPSNMNRDSLTGEIMVFTNGFILSPDRYDWNKKTGALVIKKKNGGYITDNSNSDAISFISVVGFTNNLGVDSVINQDPFTLYVDKTEYVSYSSTKYAAVGSQNSLQVWENGRLCFADHGLASSDIDMVSAGMTGSNLRQNYCLSIGPDKFEISADPMLAIRSTESSAHSSYFVSSPAKVYSGVVVASRFSTANVGFEYRPLVIKPFSFRGLDEFDNAAGSDVAIYNTYSPAFAASTWPSWSSPRHFDGATTASEFFGGTGFNGNYFVTYDSFMGFHTPEDGDHIYPGYDGQARWPDKYRSDFVTFEVSVDLLSDVPHKFGRSVLAGKTLTQDNDNPDSGYNTPPKGRVKLTDDYGLYRKLVTEDEFFSDLNPIESYAALESVMYKWLDTFGAYYEKSNGDKIYERSLGLQYDADGAISSAFAKFLSSNTQLILGVEPPNTLVDVIESVAAIKASRPRTYGWGMGYMWGNKVFNLEDGTFHNNNLSKYRYPGGPYKRYKLVVKEYRHGRYAVNDPHFGTSSGSAIQGGTRYPFNSGTYFGNVGYLNPKYVTTGSFNELLENRTYNSTVWNAGGSADTSTGLITNESHGDGGYPRGDHKNWNSARGTYTDKKGSVNNFFCNVSPLRNVRGAVPHTYSSKGGLFHNKDYYVDWSKHYSQDGTNGSENLKGVPKVSYWLENINISGYDKFSLRTYVAYGCSVEPISFFVMGDTRYFKPNYAGHSTSISDENYFVID